MTIPRVILNGIVIGAASQADKVKAGQVVIKGKKEAVNEFVATLDKFDFWFSILEH